MQTIEDSYNSENFQFELIDPLKGLLTILDGLGDASAQSHLKYMNYAMDLLVDSCSHLIDKAEEYRELIAKLDAKYKN